MEHGLNPFMVAMGLVSGGLLTAAAIASAQLGIQLVCFSFSPSFAPSVL
jgi:hypothetical protein